MREPSRPLAAPSTLRAGRILLALALCLTLGSALRAGDGRLDLLRAASDLRAQRYQEAEAVLEPLVRDYPDSLEADFYLAQALYYQGRLDQAEARFLQVAQAGPGIPVTYYYLGRIAYDRKQWPRAEAWLKRADQLDADLAMVHYYQGLVYDREQVPGEALVQFQKALDLEPSLTRAAYAQAYVLYHDFRRRDAALKALRSAAKTKDRALRRKMAKLRRDLEASR